MTNQSQKALASTSTKTLNIGGAGYQINTSGNLNLSSVGYATISASLNVGEGAVPAGVGNAVFSGNLGIGTSSPGNRLDVVGTMDASKYADSANSAYFLSPAASGNSLLVAGNIGIGTTGPGYKLDVQGGNINTSGTINTGGTQRISSTGVLSNVSGNISLWTNNSNYITSAGAPVQSVAGRTGAVTLAQADISGLTTASSPQFVTVVGTTNVDGGYLATYASGNPPQRTNYITMAYRSDIGELAVVYGASSTVYKVNVTSLSDKRLKSNIIHLTNVLPKVMQLKPSEYDFHDPRLPVGNTKHEIGLVAQDVQPLFPEIVEQTEGGPGYLALDYERLAPIAIAAIQEQQSQIDELKKEIHELKSIVCSDHPDATICVRTNP